MLAAWKPIPLALLEPKAGAEEPPPNADAGAAELNVNPDAGVALPKADAEAPPKIGAAAGAPKPRITTMDNVRAYTHARNHTSHSFCIQCRNYKFSSFANLHSNK